jgi:DNA mismatch endonuclease, patch repair protein
MDVLSPVERSARMALVRSKDTKPEWRVRRIVHALGFRYRLHSSSLPGKPDLVFPRLRKIIFVHGCFWHRHGVRCALTRMPKSRVEFWQAKLQANRKRDDKNLSRLRAAGWKVLTVWECQTEEAEVLRTRVASFLESGF